MIVVPMSAPLGRKQDQAAGSNGDPMDRGIVDRHGFIRS